MLRPFFSLTPAEEPDPDSDDTTPPETPPADPLTGPRPTANMGMGLAIAQDLAISQGGSLSLARSEDLGGLCVRLRLPVLARKKH